MSNDINGEPILVWDQRGTPEKYPRKSWRRAIERFLHGIWTQQNDYAKGTLIIDDVALSLDQGKYTVNCATSSPATPRPSFNRDQIHAITGDRKDVELGVAKFLANNHMRQLVIEFSSCRLMFWKGEGRTELHTCVVDRTF